MALLIAIVCFVGGIVAAVPIDERIIGGKDAPDGAFPYVVSLRNSTNKHVGTGTIISDSWILTIAWIFVRRNVSTIVVGTTKLSENGTTYKVSKLVVHPNFVRYEYHDDIALIQIDGKISFGPNVKAVELPSTPPTNGTDVTMAGWGSIHIGDVTLSDKLQYTSATIIDNEQCRLLSPYKSNTSICTIRQFGRGACYGDYGDPLVSKNVVFGRNAWAGLPCDQGNVDGHTNVALYTDWIKEVARK